MIHTNQKDEKNSLYKCHFCQQNIDVYGIEKHFATFHKFKHSNSFESEYICEFCDDDNIEVFFSQTNLFHHIQNTHNLDDMNDKEIIHSEAGISNIIDTLEEGKSRFLQLIVNFNSQEDVFNLLKWIKSNNTNTFIANHHEGIENQLEENVSKTFEEDDEKNL